MHRAALLLVAAACSAAAACSKDAPKGPPVSDEATGTLTVDGKPVALTACRPQHAAHIFVEVDTPAGTLRFGDGALAWNGAALTCTKLDRSWGGGVRQDGSTYFRGTLAFSCGNLFGDLTLDCGQITAAERAELDRNRAETRARQQAD